MGHTIMFKTMSFELVNSGSTFNRMMRKLLHVCSNADNYVDDSLGHTKHWEASASLVMPNGDPRDGIFFPTLSFMMDYIIAQVKSFLSMLPLVMLSVQ